MFIIATNQFKLLIKLKKLVLILVFFKLQGMELIKKILEIFVMLEISFLIHLKKIKQNFHLKNGILKIKMYTEDIFQTM